jgi:hypothetical protein
MTKIDPKDWKPLVVRDAGLKKLEEAARKSELAFRQAVIDRARKSGAITADQTLRFSNKYGQRRVAIATVGEEAGSDEDFSL